MTPVGDRDNAARLQLNEDYPAEDKQLSEWKKLYEAAEVFALKHGVASELPQKRPKKTPRRAGEKATDETPTEAKQLFKVQVFYHSLDTVIIQLKSRFTDSVLTVFRQMAHFTHLSLMTQELTAVSDVADLCSV